MLSKKNLHKLPENASSYKWLKMFQCSLAQINMGDKVCQNCLDIPLLRPCTLYMRQKLTLTHTTLNYSCNEVSVLNRSFWEFRLRLEFGRHVTLQFLCMINTCLCVTVYGKSCMIRWFQTVFVCHYMCHMVVLLVPSFGGLSVVKYLKCLLILLCYYNLLWNVFWYFYFIITGKNLFYALFYVIIARSNPLNSSTVINHGVAP